VRGLGISFIEDISWRRTCAETITRNPAGGPAEFSWRPTAIDKVHRLQGIIIDLEDVWTRAQTGRVHITWTRWVLEAKAIFHVIRPEWSPSVFSCMVPLSTRHSGLRTGAALLRFGIEHDLSIG
jgi:hypothetical protein